MQKERIAELTKQVERRNKYLRDQQKLFYSEIFKLKEQLFMQKAYGEEFQADEQPYFNPEEWLQELIGEDDINPEDSLDTIARKAQKALEKLNESYAKETEKLQRQMRVCFYDFFI